MVRIILLAILLILLARAFWRVIDGIVAGVTGRPRSVSRPVAGVQMERDPVCGTFVVPDRAVSIAKGPRRIYFCSSRCREEYRARIA